MRRAEYVSQIFGSAELASPQHATWRPRLIVPGHHNESFEWLDQTRLMFARGEFRVRHVDYENAPLGHDVYAASPYRWWLGLLAWCNHEISGSPIDRSVETAALYADPLLLLLLGVGTTVFVALRFGFLPAALVSAGLVTLFPFAAEFLPAVPDSGGLAQACAIWSVLPLIAGASTLGSPGGAETRRLRKWFVVAGVVGAVGLWVSASNEVPVVGGIALGGLLAAWVARAKAPAGLASSQRLPWRAWSLAGAVTCLFAYLLEFFPGHLGSWELRAIHPAIGIAWIGGGELLALLTARIAGEKLPGGYGGGARMALAAAALASVPTTMWLTGSLGFFAMDLPSMRLSMLPNGVSAQNLWAWLLQNGVTPAFAATMLPALLIVPAAWMLISGKIGQAQRASVAIALGPVLAALGLACWRLNLMNAADSCLLALIVATAAVARGVPGGGPLLSAALAIVAGAVFLPGAVQLWPSLALNPKGELTKGEVVALIERDLAYDLAKRESPQGSVILAPPDATTALYYYGGIPGLGTFSWDNSDGLAVAIRIASASTPEEAQELISDRGITHIVVPQWDSYMDVYAIVGSGQTNGTFLERLRHWNLPPWLRPVPYLIPNVAGFEGQSVTVLRVIDAQNDAASASRLAEYFVDMGQLELAARAAQELRRFPADLGALLARAQVAIAVGDADEFNRAVEILLRRIAGGSDRTLPWDQRVGLAILLAQAHHADLARARLRQCVDEIDGEKLRSLSTNLLFSLQEARKVLGVEIADPQMQETALDMLPADLRARVEK